MHILLILVLIVIHRMIGRRFNDKTIRENMRLWPFEVVDHDGNPYMRVRHKYTDYVWAPEEISAMILTKMKSIAETFLSHKVTHVVISVPSHFGDVQRAVM